MTVLIGILLFVASPANAAYPVILCDTAEQIEQVFILHMEGDIAFDEAIDAANKKAGAPNACMKATVDASLLEEVRDIVLRGNPYTIVKVVVTQKRSESRRSTDDAIDPGCVKTGWLL